MYIGRHVKCPSFLSDFNESRIFSTFIGKKTQMSNFMETRPVGAELFYAGVPFPRGAQLFAAAVHPTFQ